MMTSKEEILKKGTEILHYLYEMEDIRIFLQKIGEGGFVKLYFIYDEFENKCILNIYKYFASYIYFIIPCQCFLVENVDERARKIVKYLKEEYKINCSKDYILA